MIDIGLAATLTLVAAYVAGSQVPEFPPEQGPYGMTDEDLYRRIINGDPLGDMTFGEAVGQDPRRIEGLILQRVIQPFTLALVKVENPNLNTQMIQEAMEHGYLERNSQMRAQNNGRIIAKQLVEDNKRAWKANGEVLKVAFEMGTPEATVLKQLMSSNQQDIRRAFLEAREIASRAATEATTEQCVNSWQQMESVVENMGDMIERYLTASHRIEDIDDLSWIQPLAEPAEKMGAVEQQDLFGALSFDDELESMGYAYEEFIVSGHRAPGVGLAQYRRGGGRFFGGVS